MTSSLPLRLLNRFAAGVPNHAWVANSGYLLATTLLGSACGFVFWISAARLYDPAEIGRGAALIAATSLMALLGDMGLSVVLVRYLAGLADERAQFFNTLLAAMLCSTGALVLAFVLCAPLSPGDLSATASPANMAVLAAGTLALAAAQLYDRLFTALQAAHWALYRGMVMHLTRLVALAALLGRLGETSLLLAAGIGTLVSLGAAIWGFAPQALPGYRLKPGFDRRYLSSKMRYALGSHVSQLAWGLPALVFPLLIAAVLGAEANARFYTSWMAANLLLAAPLAASSAALANAAAAENRDPNPMGALWRAMRLTLAGLALPALGFSLLSRYLLSIFGESYAQGAELLTLLCLSVFPYTLNTFVINGYRLAAQPWGLVWLPASISALSLGLVGLLCGRYGLPGAGWGWLLAQSLGACLSWAGYRANLRGWKTGA